MDKHPARDFLPNIVIHNTLSICGRMADWGTQACLGRCMMWARWRACLGAGPIECRSRPKGHGTHKAPFFL